VTILGHITPEVINIFLSEAADLLGQWDEACFSLENNGDAREALLWVSRSIQSLRRASRGIGLEDFAQTLNTTDEYLRLVLRSGSISAGDVSATLMLTHNVLSRWIVGLRADAAYREDVTELNDSIRQQKASVQEVLDEERKLADARSVSLESGETQEDDQARSAARDAAVKSLVESGANAVLAQSDERIQQLIDLVARISTQQSSVETAAARVDIVSPQLKRMIGNTSRMIADLCEAAVSLRLVPIDGLFERLAVFAVESAQCKGAAIQVDYDGQTTLIDKESLGSLWEPVSKLIRWMVETSFESPEERVRSGKLPMGVLRISAHAKNSVVRIVLEDDGRGQGDGDSTPGGQNLRSFVDAARSMLRELSATLSVHSAVGRSTRIEITVPAAPRLIDLVTVNCNEQPYAIARHALEEVIDPGSFSTHILRGDKQLIEFNGKLFPFVTLVELLEKTPTAVRRRVQATVAIEKGHVLLVRIGRDTIAVGVEQIVRTIRTLVTPPQPHLDGVKGLSGTFISGTGEPVLVVDILEIAASFIGNGQEREVA